MIDHVSIGVSDLAASAKLYESALQPIGLTKLVERPGTVGFGKTYPELWLNSRPGMARLDGGSGGHVCLRARTAELVDAFWQAAVAAGAADDGAPGLRPDYGKAYYAAFVRDPDGNRVEVVTFLERG